MVRALARFLPLTWALCLAALPAWGEFRCDTDLVDRGMTPLEVVERCGTPEHDIGWTDYRYPGYFVRVDEWTYDLGHNKFRRLLTFENGRLVRVEVRNKPRGGPDPVPALPPAW